MGLHSLHALKLQELGAMLFAAGVKNVSEEDLSDIVRRLDVNKNGSIDFEEFWTWFRSSDATSELMKQRY